MFRITLVFTGLCITNIFFFVNMWFKASRWMLWSLTLDYACFFLICMNVLIAFPCQAYLKLHFKLSRVSAIIFAYSKYKINPDRVYILLQKHIYCLSFQSSSFSTTAAAIQKKMKRRNRKVICAIALVLTLVLIIVTVVLVVYYNG